MTVEEKRAKLLAMQQDFAKKYGDKKSIRLGTEVENVQPMSTGILGLDLALGKPMPRGRLVSIAGTESSCKTTTALTTIATEMKNDPTAFAYYCDVEQALDPEYAEALGVDLTRLVVDSDSVGEQALTKLRDSIASGLYSIAVLDSTNAICASKQEEETISATEMGIRARLLSATYPQLVNACGKTNTLLIVIEQIRKKIGVMFGNPETNTVGEAGKFYMTQRLMMRRQTKVEEEGGVAVSNEVKCSVIKNKVSPPFRKCDLVCIYGQGFDRVTDTANLAIQLDVVQDKGHSYKKGTDEEKKWKSKGEFIKYLSENEDFYEEIRKVTLDKYNNSDKKSVMQDDDDTDRKNAEKEKLDDLKTTSKDNSSISNGDDEFKEDE